MRSALAGAFLSTWKGRCPMSGEKESTMSAPSLCVNSSTLLLWQSGFPSQAFLVADFLPPSPLAISSHPTVVFFPGLLFNPHITALSLHVHWQTHVPIWDMQGCSTDHLYKSHSVLSATDQLFHTPLTASDAPLLSQPILCW